MIVMIVVIKFLSKQSQSKLTKATTRVELGAKPKSAKLFTRSFSESSRRG